MDWIARFLDSTQEHSCGACGASLGDSRVVLVKGAAEMWRAELQCRGCRTTQVIEVDEAGQVSEVGQAA